MLPLQWAEEKTPHGKMWTCAITVPNAPWILRWIRATITLDGGLYYSMLSVSGINGRMEIDSAANNTFEDAERRLQDALQVTARQIIKAGESWRDAFSE